MGQIVTGKHPFERLEASTTPPPSVHVTAQVGAVELGSGRRALRGKSIQAEAAQQAATYPWSGDQCISLRGADRPMQRPSRAAYRCLGILVAAAGLTKLAAHND